MRQVSFVTEPTIGDRLSHVSSGILGFASSVTRQFLSTSGH